MERDFKGVWIPKEIWLDERLTALDKIILTEIDSLDGDEGCYASNEYLAKFCQCSVTKVSTSISLLIKLGYVEVKDFDGRKRILKSRLTKIVNEPLKKCKADFKKVKDNNIYNNINNNIDIKKESKKERKYDDVFEERKVDGELKDAFVELIKSRKLNKKNMTSKALELAIDKVRKLENTEDKQIKVIYQSIENGWQGLFPLKNSEELHNMKLYEIKNGEDITWKRLFIIWEKILGYKLIEDVENVEAAKQLLELEGEDKVKLLIASLKMRGQYTYLPKDIKNIKDFSSLLENRDAVWRFYNENSDDWKKWSDNASQGKKRWAL